jgi:WD40 repeat protein
VPFARPNGYVVRVLRAGSSAPAGVGFLVGDRHILTCAHVINAALGREQRKQEAPGSDVRVQVDFPILGNVGEPPSRNCRVEAWVPPPPTGTVGGDVAGLVIVGGGEDLPAGAGPPRLEVSARQADAEVFGYPTDPPRPDGAWVTCRLSGQVHGGMIQLDPRDRTSFRAQPGYSGSPVVVTSDSLGDAVVGMLTVTSGAEGPRDAYAISVPQLADAWPEQLAPVPPCPYRGLAPFRAQDAEAGLFVGREDEANQLRAKVNGHALVMVVGPSGVGKSSLITAGLIPALLHTGEWVTTSFQPGETPFNALAMALYELESPDGKPSVEELVSRGQQLRDHGLAALTSALSVALKGKRILLHLDQFEEIFTARPDEKQDKEAAAFLDRIIPSGNADNPAYRLVCTLRADFLGHVLTHPDLGRRLQDRLLTISPMDPAALERAVTEPARTCDVTYENGLARQIAVDATGGDGGLPLMQFALTELWPRQRQRRLTFAHYHEFGRVEGALDRYAETMFAELKPRWPEERIRRVMLACVRSRGDAALATRCTVGKDFFTIPGEWDLVSQLVDLRLLTLGADPIDRTPTVELAHEALIRSWIRLKSWVDDDADFRRWLTIMEEREHDNELLPDEVRIGDAERWLAGRPTDIPPKIHQLVERSKHAARQRAHIRRRFLTILVVLLVLVAGAVGFVISSQHTVAEQRLEALSRMVADESDRAGASDPSLAMQLSLAAYRIAPTPEARGSLLRASTLHTATRILGNVGAFTAVAISPDGHALAAGSADQMVRLYDLSNPQNPAAVGSLTDHIGAITGVVFSPDGRTLASSSRDNTVRLWDLTDVHHPRPLAVLTYQAMTVISAIAVNAVAFSPDGHLLAAGSSDHTVRLWDLSNLDHPTASTTLTGPNSSVNTVVFSPDRRILASGSDDRTVTLWDLTDPHHPITSATLTGHTDAVYAVTFSPDGRTMASGGRDRTVRLWDLTDTRHPIAAATLTGQMVGVESVAFNRDGHILASGNQVGEVRLWDVTDPHHPTASAALTGHTDIVGAVAFSPDGRTLATGSEDGTVRLWNLTDPHHDPVILTARLNNSLRTDNPLDTVAFSPDGHTLASAGNDDIVRMWDLTDPRRPFLSTTLPGFNRFIETVAFSPDGHILAIADGDDTIRLWDLTDYPGHPTVPTILTGHTSVVESVTFSPDGNTLASASSDGTVRLWDLTDPRHPTASAILTGHTGVVEWVAFSPGGNTLASASDDDTIRLWDVTDPRHPSTVATLTGDTDSIEMVAFSPNGRTLASGSQDGTVRLWDVTDPHRPTASAVLSGHTGRVEAVTFSPDGHTLASGSFDGTVRLWDLTDPHHLAVILTGHNKQVEAVAFTPDGHILASGGSDNTIRLWDTSPEETAKDICGLIVTPLTRAQWLQYIPGQSYNPPCEPE